MKRFFIVALLLIFSFGCFDTKPDNVEVTINVKFPQGENCKLYLAELFEVTLFDSNQKKTATETFTCTEATDTLSLFVEKDNYYFTVALKDSNGNKKSYGSGTVDASSGDTEVDVEMTEYAGGVTFKWNSSDCSNYDIEIIKFTLLNEGEKVTTNIWGKDTELSQFEISCHAELFEVVNIPAGKYSASVNAYRKADSEVTRISYEVPEFKITTGTDSPLDINDYKEIKVSDLIINWNFDSRSINSCSEVNVSTIAASLISNDLTKTAEQPCDDTFSAIKIYDIPKGSYDILLQGLSNSDTALFEGNAQIDIETGSIGSDSLTQEIFIKEKN